MPFDHKIAEINAGRHKALVFSQFVKHLELLRNELMIWTSPTNTLMVRLPRSVEKRMSARSKLAKCF